MTERNKKCPRGVVMNIGKENEAIEFKKTTVSGILSFTMICNKRTFNIMNFKEYKKELMKDPEFVKAYEDLQPEMDIVKAIIDARIKQNLSQKELSKLTGINQSEISKLESGERNPSIKLLQRLADGMGLTLKISFVPKTQA